MARYPHSPVWRYGGKGKLAGRILDLLPAHAAYAEPFAGGASILFAKPRAGAEFLADVDPGLVAFLAVLADPERFPLFYRRVAVLPYSRRLWAEYRAAAAGLDPIGQAVRWYVRSRQSFAGKAESWGFTVATSYNGMAGVVSHWHGALAGLPAAHARLAGVTVECQEWRASLAAWDAPGVLWYVDPPYHPDTLSGRLPYPGMTAQDHADLADRLDHLAGMVVLSGYRNPAYSALEARGWVRVDLATSCHAAGRTRTSGLQGRGQVSARQARTESVWLNPAAQAARSVTFRIPNPTHGEPHARLV